MKSIASATEVTALLDRQLNRIKQEQFTGQLIVRAAKNLEWQIYCCLGRLVWIDGGYHPHRSWLRILSQNCPQVKLNRTFITIAKKYQCWNYRILLSLLTNQTIDNNQFSAIVEVKISEAIFDIIQQEKKESLEYLLKSTSADYLLDCGLKISSTLVDVDKVLQTTQENERTWSKFDRQNNNYWSPNLAPVIKDLDRLKQEVNQDVYNNFVKLINGNYTLRDLAVKLDRKVELLTSSLIPYINKGLLDLKEVSDIPENIVSFNSINSNKSSATQDRSKPLIACIDDSPQILKIMEQIIIKQGYNFIGIQQSLKAIPTIIASNPDLIFLDIGMPIVNGYEVCSQIKRISKFQNKPIIMLTGQDGIVDRVKAKMSGASEFITKPIEINKIITIMKQFLNCSQVM
ncbi:MAG: response regulator [Prochloraceae cyanobacterium]|nr:response regulator [Prochloraceae cyanobacterium]